VAYGFTNRGAYQLERFAVLIRFDYEIVALKRFRAISWLSLPIVHNIHYSWSTRSGFEGQANQLDLDRCAQYMAGKLTDYYCAKKAEESKNYDDTSVICKRRKEQLSHTASDNSTVLTVTSRIRKSTVVCCMMISYMPIMLPFRSLFMWVYFLVLLR
jgi:hypothetical protein